MNRRIYKKRYKSCLSQIADKIPAAFKDENEKKQWISEVTNLRMNDLQERKNRKNGSK